MKLLCACFLGLATLVPSHDAHAARLVKGVLLEVDHSQGRTSVTFATLQTQSGTTPACHTHPNNNTFILDTDLNELSNGAEALLIGVATGAPVTIFGRNSCEENIQEINQIRIHGS